MSSQSWNNAFVKWNGKAKRSHKWVIIIFNKCAVYKVLSIINVSVLSLLYSIY